MRRQRGNSPLRRVMRNRTAGVKSGSGGSDIPESYEEAGNEEAVVVPQARVAGYERNPGVVGAVERQLLLRNEVGVADRVQVIAALGPQDDVDVLAVAQQRGDAGKGEEDVAFALDGAFEMTEVPAIAVGAGVGRRGDVPDNELGGFVGDADGEVGDGKLLDEGVDVELGNDDALGPSGAAIDDGLAVAADWSEAVEVGLREGDGPSRVGPLARGNESAGVEGGEFRGWAGGRSGRGLSASAGGPAWAAPWERAA